MATEFLECPTCRQQIECDVDDIADDPISRMTNEPIPRAFQEHLNAHQRRGREVQLREWSPEMEQSAEAMFGAPAEEVQMMFASSGVLMGKPTEADMTDLDDGDLLGLVWFDIAGPLETMPHEHATIWHVGELRAQYDNGGLVQYFSNTRGEYFNEARAALQRLNAEHHLTVFERAIAIYEREKLLPDSWWIEDLDERAYESEIEQLDDEFGKLDLATFAAAYIRANAPPFLD